MMLEHARMHLYLSEGNWKAAAEDIINRFDYLDKVNLGSLRYIIRRWNGYKTWVRVDTKGGLTYLYWSSETGFQKTSTIVGSVESSVSVWLNRSDAERLDSAGLLRQNVK